MSTSLTDQTAGWKTETESAENTFGAFVRMDFDGYTLRAFSGAGQLEWDDGTGTQTWQGVPLGSVTRIPGKSSFESQAAQIDLSGLDSSIKSEVLDYTERGTPVYIWLFYVSGGSIVSDPWLAFSGKIDGVSFKESDTVDLTIRAVDAVGAAFRRTVTRRTDVEQQSLFSGDRIYEFTASVAREVVKWGVPWEGSQGNAPGSNPIREGPVTNARVV